MKKQIVYDVPCWDSATNTYDHSRMTRHTVIANNEDEYAANMEVINKPAHSIVLISIEDIVD